MTHKQMRTIIARYTRQSNPFHCITHSTNQFNSIHLSPSSITMSYIRKGRRPLPYSDRSQVSTALSSHYSESAVSNVTPPTQFQQPLSHVVVRDPYKNGRHIPHSFNRYNKKPVEIRVQPKVQMPRGMNSDWKKARRREQRRREEAQKRDVKVRYRLRHRASDDSICSELEPKYENLMKDTQNDRHRKEGHRIEATYDKLIAQKGIKEAKSKWVQSALNYKNHEAEMYDKAREDLYERKKQLKSLNYTMNEELKANGATSLQDLNRKNQLKKRQLAREKMDHEFKGKMNEVERMMAMIDSGLIKDVEGANERIQEMMYKATERHQQEKMEKKERRERREMRKKEKRKKTTHSTLDTLQSAREAERVKRRTHSVFDMLDDAPDPNARDHFDGDIMLQGGLR